MRKYLAIACVAFVFTACASVPQPPLHGASNPRLPASNCSSVTTDYAGDRPLISKLMSIEFSDITAGDGTTYAQKFTCEYKGKKLNASVSTPHDFTKSPCTVTTSLGFYEEKVSLTVTSVKETAPGKFAFKDSNETPIECEATPLPVAKKYIDRALSAAHFLRDANPEGEREIELEIASAYSKVYPSGAIGTKVCVEKKFLSANDRNGVMYQQFEMEWTKWPSSGPLYFDFKSKGESTYPTICRE